MSREGSCVSGFALCLRLVVAKDLEGVSIHSRYRVPLGYTMDLCGSRCKADSVAFGAQLPSANCTQRFSLVDSSFQSVSLSVLAPAEVEQVSALGGSALPLQQHG